MTRLGAILLAAGGAKRMGRQKLLLRWGDDMEQTVIGSALGALMGAPVDWIGLVTGALGKSVARRARTAYRLWPVPAEERPFLRVIHNPLWEEGMRSSIVLGLRQLPPHLDGVFIALGDMPAVPTAVYQQLAEAFVQTPNQIFRPICRGRPGHPVLFPRKLLTKIDPKGDEGLKHLLREHKDRVKLIEVEDAGVLLDLDTPETYRAALYLRRARKPSPEAAAALHSPAEEA